jgi:hypothetical protein
MKGVSMFMFKVILQLNEEQVKKDNEFNLSDIYKEIDNLYKETGCYLLEKENGKYIYTIDNIEEAPARLVPPSLEIRNLPWFKYMKEFYLANNTYNEWVYDDMLKDWRETFYAN